MTRTRIATALGATLVTLLSGCAVPDRGNAAGVGHDDTGLSAVSGGSDCDSGGNPMMTPAPLTPLPADAVLVKATRCLFEPRTVAGDGEWLTRLEQEATAGLDGLAAALRLPSRKAVAGQLCDLVAYAPIVITVTDTAGRQFHPQVPYGACAEPLRAATDAIAALSWMTVGTTKIRQTRSELEVSSGCPNGWKPTIPMTADGSGTQVTEVNATARELRVCRFDLDPDPSNVITLGETGRSYRMGKLAIASTMDAAAGGELLAAVAKAPRASGACAQPEAPFAVVHPVDGSPLWVTVERGGCSRALIDGENYLRQLDAALVSRLIG